MSNWRATRYGLFAFVLLLIAAASSVTQIGNPVLAGNDPGDAAALLPASRPAQYNTKLAGAYFFYWWLFPNDPDDIDPPTHVAFHPPGLVDGDQWYHSDPYSIRYTGGTYNTTYYNVNTQRWWEWQFRGMAEAGLDIAFMTSWDVVSLYDPDDPLSGWTNDAKTIFTVKDHLTSALNLIGNPIKIALFDDTYSEYHQWNVDNNNSPFEEMPLDGETNGLSNRQYFWRKAIMFYDAIPMDKWATHNGLPVEQGGRPLILMWKAQDFFTNTTSIDPGTGQTYAVGVMCEIKQNFYDTYGVEPFLLPNWNWWWLDNTVHFDTICPGGFGFHAIDGYSEFGMADGGVDTRIHDIAGYTTAYVGPGRDDCAYSGPFGEVANPPNCTLATYNARWWGKLQTPEVTINQANFYDLTWNDIIAWQQFHSPGAVNLVVIESWNELKEGSAIAQIDTYIGPDLGENACTEPPYDPSKCEAFFFNKNPGEDDPLPGEPERTRHYWIEKTHKRVEEWKDETPAVIIVDNNNYCSAGQDGDFTSSGGWTCSWFDQNYCDDACYISRNDTGWAEWEPWLTPGDGIYDVYAHWQWDTLGTQDVHYQVYGADSSVVRIDQSRRRDAGRWNYLGRFPFTSGSGVRLTNVVEHPQGDHVLADAIRLVYRESYTPRPPWLYLPMVVKNFSRCSESLRSGGFEGGQDWIESTIHPTLPVVCDWANSSNPYTENCGGYYMPQGVYNGTWSAKMAGYDHADDTLFQTVNVPENLTSARLYFQRFISTDEPGEHIFDEFHVQLYDGLGGFITEILTLSNLDAGSWVEEIADIYSDIAPYQGEEIQVYFWATNDFLLPTFFFLDDVSLIFCVDGLQGRGSVPPTPPPEGAYPPPTPRDPGPPTPTPPGEYPPPPTPTPMPTHTPAPPLPTLPPLPTPDPLLGLNFPLTTGPGREPQQRAAAAYAPSAQRYLVAWEQEDATIGTDPNVYARLVSDEGSVLLEAIPIAVEPGWQTTPDVAYDPDHGRFLVVWSDFSTKLYHIDILGRFYDTAGQPLSDAFPIAQTTTSEDNPAVAYGGGHFLVVWEVGGADVYASLIGPEGQVEPPLEIAVDPFADEGDPAVAYGDGSFLALWGDSTQIFARSVDLAGNVGSPEPVSNRIPDGAGAPAIAYGGNDTYLAVWVQAGSNTTDAYARLVDGTGLPVDDPLLVTGSPWSVPYPDVAFSGNQYLVVFSYTGPIVPPAMVGGVRVSPQGELVGDPILVRADPAWSYGPAVAAGPGGEFLGLWGERPDGFAQNILAQRVSPAGELLGPTVLVGSALLPPDQDMVAISYGDDTYLTVWEQMPPDITVIDYDLYGRFVDPGGAFPGEIVPLVTGVGNARMPALTYNPDTAEFLLAYSADDGMGGPPQIYLQRVGPAVPIDDPLLVAPSSSVQTHPDIIYGGPGSDRLLVVWQEEGKKLKDRRVHARLLDGQGNPLGAPFVLAERKQDGGEYQQDAALAADLNTGHFLVVWSGRLGQERIYLQTITYDGYVDTEPPTEVSESAGNVETRHPDIAGWNGLYVVVWERAEHNQVSDIYLRRVSIAKELTGLEETLLVEGGVDQFLPCIAQAGPDEVLVVWQEGKKGDIVGQRLRRGDLASMGGRLELSWQVEPVAGRAAGTQLRPALAGDVQRRRYLAVWTDGRNAETSGLDVYGQLCRGF